MDVFILVVSIVSQYQLITSRQCNGKNSALTRLEVDAANKANKRHNVYIELGDATQGSNIDVQT